MNIDNRPIDEKIADLKDKVKFTIDDIDIVPDCENINNKTLLRGILTGQWATLDTAIAILEELQKMQQPKVCEWDLHESNDKEVSCFTGCNRQYKVKHYMPLYCDECGGKIEINEIDKENVQK